jgi:hypothetical protein
MRCFFLFALSPLVLFPAFSQFIYDESELCFLEEQIPELAVMALKLAYREALASGSCVLIVKDGTLVEVSPDGSERIIKELPRWIPVTPGKYLRISVQTEASVE